MVEPSSRTILLRTSPFCRNQITAKTRAVPGKNKTKFSLVPAANPMAIAPQIRFPFPPSIRYRQQKKNAQRVSAVTCKSVWVVEDSRITNGAAAQMEAAKIAASRFAPVKPAIRYTPMMVASPAIHWTNCTSESFPIPIISQV